MPNKNNVVFQTSQYDKIIRENLEQTLPVIIKDLLHLDIVESEEIPDDIQHTKERKPDALKKVKDSEGNTYILHLEFQVPNEKEMVYRMAEYSIMLMRRYKIAVKQFVIFLKAGKPTMATTIDSLNLKYNYELVRISEVNYKLFLRSKDPEVKMLGILANLGDDNPEEAIQAIVNEISNTTESNLAKNKYFNQLRIFVQLRTNVEHQLEKVMQSISTFFKEENDIFYRKGERIGIEKGIEKNRHTVIENLLTKLGVSDEKAAEIAEVSIEYVKEIRARLDKK
nr:Rpn family recombination-promoting nuclease/putative transposase [uncultured Pedobacter sp.]